MTEYLETEISFNRGACIWDYLYLLMMYFEKQ